MWKVRKMGNLDTIEGAHKIRIIAILFPVFFLTGCTSTIVKPVYIDREIDLSKQLEKDYKTLQGNPDWVTLSRALNNGKTYRDRIDYKLRENNKRSL